MRNQEGFTSAASVGAVGPLLHLPDVGAVALVASAFRARLPLLSPRAVALVHAGRRTVDTAIGVHAVHLAELVALTAALGALQQSQSNRS